MSMLMLSDLADTDVSLLQQRARQNGRTTEEEASLIITQAIRRDNVGTAAGADWIQELISLGQSVGGVDLEIPARETARIPDLS